MIKKAAVLALSFFLFRSQVRAALDGKPVSPTSDMALSSPTFRDPLTHDPMLARSLSLISPGMGHFYNGNAGKMRKWQARASMARLPFLAGICLDIGHDRLKGVDQFKDLTVKNFPWFSLGGLVLSGALREMVRDEDARQAYEDAQRLNENSEEAGSKAK